MGHRRSQTRQMALHRNVNVRRGKCSAIGLGCRWHTAKREVELGAHLETLHRYGPRNKREESGISLPGWLDELGRGALDGCAAAKGDHSDCLERRGRGPREGEMKENATTGKVNRIGAGRKKIEEWLKREKGFGGEEDTGHADRAPGFRRGVAWCGVPQWQCWRVPTWHGEAFVESLPGMTLTPWNDHNTQIGVH
ncbi:hypothetical protein B0H16DRAFT_1452924 [Mycena metata]|uniref:Uncharacterized protein n=1 Tax=Mycena metata TaxID=1033252 RepID=A0AAD7NNX9_9AGAR|nr:hypothetical protein B0H16DRAFT_1452924 [Mycena metata]